MKDTKFARAICPFCEQGFNEPQAKDGQPILWDEEYASSCGCGATFTLVEADDVDEVKGCIEERGEAVEFLLVRNFDEVTEEHQAVHALFWRKKV